MQTLLQALRRSAVATLGLAAFASTAGAQGTPVPDDDPTTTDTSQGTDPMTNDQGVDPTGMGTSRNTTVIVEPPAPPPAPQPIVQPAPTYVTTPVIVDNTDDDSTLERYGIGVALGGGVEGFTSDTLRNTTNDGGNWNVRLAFGTRQPLGFEAAYFGSAQSIDAFGLDDDALLVGNGLQGNLRLNLVDANVQPFVFGGLAWRRYTLQNTDVNTSDILDSDDVLEIPMGAGVAWKYAGFMFDARGEFRYADQEDLVPEFADNGALDDTGTMHRWGVNANIGLAF